MANGQVADHQNRWYVVQSGDYCAKIQDQFGITFAQFQTWNPVSLIELAKTRSSS